MRQKARFIAFFTVLLFCLLSGCSNAPANTGSGDGAAVAVVNGVAITARQVYTRINFYISQQNLTQEDVKQDPEVWERLKSDVLKELEGNVLAMDEAVKTGMDKLTPEEQDALDKAVNARIDGLKSALKSDVAAKAYVDRSIDVDSEVEKQFSSTLQSLGFTLDSYKQQIKDDFIINKVKTSYTKDIAVTDAELKQSYDSNLGQQKKAIQGSPSTIESFLSFKSPIYYYPAGYRYVRHILLKLPSETVGQAAILQTQGKQGELQDLIKPELEKIKPKAQDVLNKLNGGESFGQLIDTYNEDEAMKEAAVKSEGFLIGPYTANALQEYVSAAAALQKPGDHTGLVPTFMGYYIIEAVKIIPEGPVPYEQLQGSIRQQILQYKQAMQWENVKKGWLDNVRKAGRLVEHPEVMK